MGVDIKIKNLSFHGFQIILQIWEIDVLKIEFESLLPGYLRGLSGIIVIYDLTNKESLSKITEILNLIDTYKDSQKEIPIIIVANKTDLGKKIVLSLEDVIKITDKSKIYDYRKSSALLGENVSETFKKLVEGMMKKAQFI
jgi:GTPase SAR1 family protein